MAGLFPSIGSALETRRYIEDGIKQYHGHEKYLQDKTTNLYYDDGMIRAKPYVRHILGPRQ